MKRLNELYPVSYDTLIKGVKINSQDVEAGDLFVCVKGVTCDRHDFVSDAIKNGASAIVASRPLRVSVPVIMVEDTNKELPNLMARFCDNPQNELSLIGVTGTNGKTTVAQLVQCLLGDSCGYIGTNGIKCKEFEEPIRNTTPDVDRMYPYLKRFVDAGCKYVSMETSSEAFFRKRLDSFSFDVTIFTNITEDHLNVHKTLENYVECKMELFKKTKKGGTSVINRDSKYYEKIRSCCHENVLTYGYNDNANLQIKDVKLNDNSTDIEFSFEGKIYQINSPLVGSFNVENLMAALLAVKACGQEIEEINARIANIKQVKGRMEYLDFGQNYKIILDYAHTPDALDKILTFLNSVKKNRIITITGSAGGREKEKRKDMGKVVLEKSDLVIFTMDDPRDEDVDDIIDDLVGNSKMTNFYRVTKRDEAIKKALDMAQKDDIILIAGKGRDNYMAIGHEYLPYSDYDEVCKYFNKS